MVEGCASVDRRPARVEADLRIARGLDYYTGTVFEIGHGRLRAARVRSAPAAGTTRWPATARTTYPGVGISLGVSRTAGAAARRGPADRDRPVPSAVLVALADEAVPRGQRPGGAAAARPRRAHRGRRRAAEVRQADPVRRAPWHPLRVVPGRRRPARPGQGHPQRRPGRGRRRARGPRRTTTCTPQISTPEATDKEQHQ